MIQLLPTQPISLGLLDRIIVVVVISHVFKTLIQTSTLIINCFSEERIKLSKVTIDYSKLFVRFLNFNFSLQSKYMLDFLSVGTLNLLPFNDNPCYSWYSLNHAILPKSQQDAGLTFSAFPSARVGSFGSVQITYAWLACWLLSMSMDISHRKIILFEGGVALLSLGCFKIALPEAKTDRSRGSIFEFTLSDQCGLKYY